MISVLKLIVGSVLCVLATLAFTEVVFVQVGFMSESSGTNYRELHLAAWKLLVVGIIILPDKVNW